MKVLLAACAVIGLLGTAAFIFFEKRTQQTAPEPFFKRDLTPYGFPTEGNDQPIQNYTDLTFLTDDLVLVSVNTRTLGTVELMNTDVPLSKLVLFDLPAMAVVKTADFAVEKRRDSVKWLNDGRFVLFNQSGLNFCSQSLDCRKAIDGSDPIFVSPRGSHIMVGGNGQEPQRLFETNSLKELDEFPWRGPKAIPGDDGILLWEEPTWSDARKISVGGKMYVRMPDHSEHQLPISSYGISWPDARFLNDKIVAGFISTKSLGVARLDGTILYQKPITQFWGSLNEILPMVPGTVFCFHEAGYTKLNSVTNFLDIKDARPYNTETITVFETESGRTIFRSEWDPRPYVRPLGSPAFSPNGHELGVMHGSYLEVYRIP
jgi:hypothetical protein